MEDREIKLAVSKMIFWVVGQKGLNLYIISSQSKFNMQYYDLISIRLPISHIPKSHSIADTNPSYYLLQ